MVNAKKHKEPQDINESYPKMSNAVTCCNNICYR